MSFFFRGLLTSTAGDLSPHTRRLRFPPERAALLLLVKWIAEQPGTSSNRQFLALSRQACSLRRLQAQRRTLGFQGVERIVTLFHQWKATGPERHSGAPRRKPDVTCLPGPYRIGPRTGTHFPVRSFPGIGLIREPVPTSRSDAFPGIGLIREPVPTSRSDLFQASD